MTDNLNSCYQRHIESLLDKLLPVAEQPITAPLQDAMRYASIGGGKRLRPMLVYASGRALGLSDDSLDQAALAVELIHCYSLIHDDLPAMDDDDLRRGQPTVHIAYNEATAILAGDALQTLAFEVLIRQTGVADSSKVNALQILSRAAMDMVRGQAQDISFEGEKPDRELLEQMLQLKTGALIRASTLLPTAYADNIPESKCAALADYAAAIGLAFQIRDDVLDVTGDTEVMGKPQGSDADLDKASWTARFGVDEAHVRIGQLYERAIIALEHFDDSANMLRDLAEQMIIRNH